VNARTLLEDLFPSKCALRIVAHLLERGELNVSELVRLTGMPHKSVVKNVSWLKRLGIIKEKRFGRIRVYEIVRSDPIVTALYKLNRELDFKRTTGELLLVVRDGSR